MSGDTWIALGVGAIVLFFAVLVVYKVARYGLKGVLFNGRIDDTVGEVSAREWDVEDTTFKVHRVSNERGAFIGLEIKQSSTSSVSINGVALDRAEARALGELLLRAADSKAAPGGPAP